VASGGITSASFGAGAIDAAAIAANAIGASELASDAVAEIQSGLSTLTAAQVQTEAEEALQTYHLDHLIAAADPGGVVANSSFLAKLVSKSATPAFSSFDNTTDALEALRDNVGTNGAALSLAKTTNITGFNDVSAAQVNAEADTALADVGLTTTITGRIDVAVSTRLASASYTTPPTATENADALLKRDMSAVTGEAARSPLNAFRFNRNKFTISGGTLTVYEEDDTTVAWTATITQTAGDPVSASDPA
jgi:hypothetical protein